MRNYLIRLVGSGGPLDTRRFVLNEGEDEGSRIKDELVECIGEWTLAAGDTIQIEEDV